MPKIVKMSTGPSQPRNIVVIGGGVVGCCTAYYLTRHPKYDARRDTITIVEASGIAAAASGKAGGLIALWAQPSCIVPLSFQLHLDLAARHGGSARWGYRRIHSARLGARGRQESAGSASGAAKAEPPSAHLSASPAAANMVIPSLPPDLDWLHVEEVDNYRSIGTPENTAQVLPYEFTTAMAELAVEEGATVTLGRVTSINSDNGHVRSVTYTPKGGEQDSRTSTTLSATDVIICAGPWTHAIYPAVPIAGLRQSSVVIRPARPLPAYMLFVEISLAASGGRRAQHVTSEIFTRPNDTVWVAGDTDDTSSTDMPLTADAVVTDREACGNIVAYVGAISDELGASEVVARQTCYLPNVEVDVPGPILGPTGLDGLWIAAGHSCWGIQNGPATGKIMSEFVFDGAATSADVSELDIKLLDSIMDD